MEPVIPKVVENGGDKGKFIFEAWGSVEVLDKDGQILPVGEVMKAMPSMLRRGGVIHLGHTNRVVGRVMDFWKSDWIDPENQDRKIPGIMFKAELFNDYKSDLEARKGVIDGRYMMVSFGGMSWKGEHVSGSKGEAELMKDLEGWEYALVERGKNPLAYLTTINGVVVAKGDYDSPFEELIKDQRFNNILQSYLMDGVRYSEAINKAKNDYFNVRHDNELRKQRLNKGDTMGDEQNTPESPTEVLSLEDLQKGYYDLAEAIEVMKELVGEMAEGYLELTKEIVKPEDPDSKGHPNPPPTVTKGEDIEYDPEEEGRLMAKGFLEELQNSGYTKAGTPEVKSETGGKSLKKGVTEPDLMPEEFEKQYEAMMARRLNKGLDSKFDFSEEGQKMMEGTVIPISRKKEGE